MTYLGDGRWVPAWLLGPRLRSVVCARPYTSGTVFTYPLWVTLTSTGPQHVVDPCT